MLAYIILCENKLLKLIRNGLKTRDGCGCGFIVISANSGEIASWASKWNTCTRCHLPAGSISITTPLYIYRFRSRNIAHSGMIAQFRVGIQYSLSSLKHTASIAVTSTEVRKFLI